MFPFQINNYKASQPLDTQVQQLNRYISQQQDQGFLQKQPMVLQILSDILGMSVPQIQLPIKRKNIISNPLCIYTNNIFMYPQQIDHIPQQIKQLSIENNKSNQILQKIIEIYSNEEPNAKISQFTNNKKMICIYNRHNQNLANKNDMTIYIKNIKIAVQNDMLKSFDKVLNEENNNLPLNQNKIVTNTRFRLEFNSNFQGSNLNCVFWENNTNNYYLFLQNDINTHGYNQWYGFCARVIDNFQQPKQINKNVTNLPSRKLHKINKKQSKNQETGQNVYYANIIIVNISKNIKYKNSMSILIQKNGKWSYNTPFLYYKNKYQRYNYANYYTIHFKHCFQVDKNRKKQQINKENNMAYFYLSYPYNYTKLVKYLRQLKTVSSNKWKIQIQNIGKSQGNNQIYMVSFINKLNKTMYNTIHNQDNGQLRNSKKITKNKKNCIIILARQHPGETVSSFICEHLINQIRNSQNNSHNQPFDWFIFPMANPDGVIHGNTRTNIKGYDINRCWMKNMLFFCSQVSAINKAIQQLREKYFISYVLDLHGHSRDYGSFAYFSQDNDVSKVFNLLISQKCSFFNYYKSKYGIDYKKRPTFRGQMFYRNQIKNSITIEVSLFGQKIINQKGNSQIRPFTEDKFKELSRAIYNSIVQLEETKEQSLTIKLDTNLNIKNAMKKVSELQNNRQKIYHGEDEKSSADSDSDPQDQYLQKIERLSVGIDVPEEKVSQTLLNQKQSHTSKFQILGSKPQYNAKLNKVYNQKIQQKQQIRTALLHKYNNFHKKNKQGKVKRKPIYTNSNVQILTFEKMQQLDKSLKKYSYDQSNQVLSQKTINQIKQTKNKRTHLRLSSRKINGHQMKSKQSLVYPTASNIKIDLLKAASYQQQDALYYSTKEWNIKQKNITNFLTQTKKQRTKSIINIQQNSQNDKNKYRKITTSEHKRKQSHKQLIKLKQYLLTKNKTKLFLPSRQEMNKTMIAIVSKRIKTG